ncbi:hypothetical protein MATL_G00254230 [Megalops atlanticus]|uniref:SSD domain-containing protein n=1 Tax=Megalops atlanticus TaxID=7932 RepID=A0A9D3P9S7_MEGAT|nr:hypothetical protein MATL_G00254230 [Megalops atlanticus]
MARCRTNCIEKRLSAAFQAFGGFIGRHPLWFFVTPLLVSAALGSGFMFLKDREANDIEDQFTPVNGPAKKERQVVQDQFPFNDSEFSQLRMYSEGTYASLIAVSRSENILTEGAFEEIIRLDEEVKALNVSMGGEQFTYSSLCATTNGKCVPNAVLDIINYTASEITKVNITLPLSKFKGRFVFLGSQVGGVEPNSTRKQNAKAIRFYYFLRENETASKLWLDAFIKTFANETTHGLKEVSVSYFTSESRQEEFKGNTKSVIPFFSITYFLAINFSILSCLRLDCVRNKVWVATVGVLSAGLAVLSSFGLLLHCGIPFSMTAASSPFLILGIGVDDMFILISCWQQTNVHDTVQDRLAETYKEAAVSITITTLTDALAFYIGVMTSFRSVQSFCLYTSTAVLFCYIYSITFFGAFLSLNGRREESNRHWLTCMKVPVECPSERSGCFICSLWVTFAIASVIVGVAGFMALWGVNLDSISMINLVICIGFSVDFSAHISYSFVSSKEPTANEKAIDSLFTLGYPIVQGAVSTILGVVVLSAAKSYIFRTFFKIMFLVISFGLAHGIAFIPVFLTLCEMCQSSKVQNRGKASDDGITMVGF